MSGRRPWTARPARALAGALLALALAACDDGGEGPIGAPGGRDGVQLTYASPGVRVVETGGPTRVRLAVRVRRAQPDDALEPWEGATVTVSREDGSGTLLSTRATTDADGVASVELLAKGSPDRTRVVFVLEGDRGSHLPFEVVTAPVVPVDLAPGAVLDLDPPRNGAILRFAVAPGTAWVFMPIHLDPQRSAVPYRFLHAGPEGGGAALGVPSRGAAAGSRPPVIAEDRGHVVAGEVDAGFLAPSSDILESVNIRSCLVAANRFAPLRYLGRHVAIYVDGSVDEGQARIDSLGKAFDEVIFPTNSGLFGPTTDHDGNGVVVVVMTPELRGIGGVYCDSIRLARVEAFQAAWNPDDPIDRTLGTLAHEHQHVVNAGWHFPSRSIGDERWLNEAMSYAAEPRSGYWSTPLVRAWQFLSGQNGGVRMLPFEFAELFSDEYMMFLTYLGDRFGPEFYRALGSSGLRGAENVEAAAGEPFATLVRDWLVASGVSGRDPAIPEKYRYRTIDLHGMEEEIAACDCVPGASLGGMALELLGVETPFDVFRSLDGYDADYYRVDATPHAGGTVDVFFDAFGLQSMKLTVARVRTETAP